MNLFLSLQEELAAARYESDKIIDRIKELGQMYLDHGMRDSGYVLLFAAAILEAERQRRR